MGTSSCLGLAFSVCTEASENTDTQDFVVLLFVCAISYNQIIEVSQRTQAFQWNMENMISYI